MTLPASTFERTLVVVGHPDDETLGCGGTLARVAAAGGKVRILCLAEGISARYDVTEIDSDMVKEAIERRNNMAVAAIKALGLSSADLHIGSGICCRLDMVPMLDLTKTIEAHIREFDPGVILTHSAQDVNQDHRITAQAVLPAIRPLPGASLREVHAMEILSATEWNPGNPFQPTMFVDVSDHMEAREKALLAYEEEMPPPPHARSLENFNAQARRRGSQAGVPFAEAYAAMRIIR